MKSLKLGYLPVNCNEYKVNGVIVMKERFWYSPIYMKDNYGFYVTKYNNKHFLGYKYKNGRSIEVKIKKVSFDTIKKEWK